MKFSAWKRKQIESLKKDLLRKYKTAQDTFGDADEEDQANLKKFSFICLLSFDVYVKKDDDRAYNRRDESGIGA